MAPRKRKVAVLPANSPEKVKFSTAVIQTMLEAQNNETTHAKLVKQLKQHYANVPHDSFMKSFVQVVKRQVAHEEGNPYANNLLKFCAKFVADPAFSQQTITHPIIVTFFNFLLDNISRVPLVRFRVCQMVNFILNALGTDAALDDTVCDKILRYMLERVRDVSQHVRVQAVLALARLQDPGSSEDPVFRAYIYHLDKDPSSKVRQTIISSLERSYRSIPFILDRLWDADERVRRHTYMQMSSYPVRQYKVAHRLIFLEQGLADHSEAVRKVVRNVMIPQWIETYQRNYVAFVEALKLDADEKEMERFRKTSKMVLIEIFSKKGVKEMANLLNFSEENKTVALEDLTLERAICWQAMLEYLQKSDGDELDDYMMELSKFCEYVKALVQNPATAGFMKSGNNTSIVSDQSQSPSGQRSETMDKLQQLYFQTILQILLEIMSIYDFGDEFGRESLKLVLSDVLCNELLFEPNVRLIMGTFEKLITDVEVRLNFFVEFVGSVLEPSRQDVSHSSRLLVDTYLERHPELTPLKMQISALRLKILDLQEQESSLSAQKDYAGAQLANEKLNTCNEEYANLVKPLVQEMANSTSCIGEDTTSSIIFRESILKSRRVNQATIEKCLQICFYLVNSGTVRGITPNVCELYRSFISRHVQSGQLSTRNWALRVSTAFSMLYDGLSKETFQLLYQQFLNTASTRLWKTAIECVFELLDRYGFEHFDLENEDTSKEDSRSSKNSRQLFNRHNSSYPDELSQSTQCNGNEFYRMSIHFMDTCDDDSICAAIIEGFCRLFLHGRCTSGDIMSKLLLRYFNPTTDARTQQMLGIFFQQLIKRRRQEIVQKALLSTLFIVLEAPNESPLAEVRPATVIKFVIDSTKPVFCAPGVNPHNTIAVTFLRVMRDNLSLKDLLKLLSHELLVLDIKEDPALRTDLATAADEILKEPYLDPKTSKNLTMFREIMLGKIRETLTFSSSRGGKFSESGEQTGADERESHPVLNADSQEEDDETEQEADDDDEEQRDNERPQINKSILQEDSDADLLASPLKHTGVSSAVAFSPEKNNRNEQGALDSGVKSIRRSQLFGNGTSPSKASTNSSGGTFKIPDASTLRRIQAVRAKESHAITKLPAPASKHADLEKETSEEDEDFEIPSSTVSDSPQDEQQGSESSSDSESDGEIRETQSSVPAPRRKSSSKRASTRTNRSASKSPSSMSSSSEDEAVDQSPNATTSRINRPARPLNKVSAKAIYDRKLIETPKTLPRATRHTSRLDEANNKRMTRRSYTAEIKEAAAGSSPKATSKNRSTLSKKTLVIMSSPRVVISPMKIRPSSGAKDDSTSFDSPSTRALPSVVSTSTPRTPTRTSTRNAVGGGSSTSSPGSKRTHAQRSSTVGGANAPGSPITTRRTASASNESGTSAPSPTRLKRASVVLTPLSGPRMSRQSKKSESPALDISPRRTTRKATKI